jgi:hypothetical protein
MSTQSRSSWAAVLMLAATAGGCSAGGESTPAGDSDEATSVVSSAENARRKAAIRKHFEAQRAKLTIRATSVLQSGHVVDWVDATSQVPDGKVAEAPPALEKVELSEKQAQTELEQDPGMHGPEGTVPVLRRDSDFVLDNVTLPATVEEFLNANQRIHDEAADPAGGLDAYGHQGWSNFAHRYAQASQVVATDNVYGTDGYIYVADPYVWRNDEFSLAQMGLSRGAGAAKQTVEVGWQDFRNYYGDFRPHLFVFFTTNNYNGYGNNVGGYNTDYSGWVQSSTTLFPGAALTVGSELYIRVLMYGGNWWVNVNNQWVGYYPGTLFANTGIRNWANTVQWFGELLDYTPDGLTTQTDMGNGLYAASGSAYMRNLRWENTTATQSNLNAGFGATTPACWSVQGFNNSATTWRTYMYFGGPGRNGTTCL